MIRLAVLTLFVLPGAATAQSVDSRLNDLQRSMSALSTQIEQLKVQNTQLQQRLEKMQTSYEQRIERLEKRPAALAAKPPPPRAGAPKQ